MSSSEAENDQPVDAVDGQRRNTVMRANPAWAESDNVRPPDDSIASMSTGLRNDGQNLSRFSPHKEMKYTQMANSDADRYKDIQHQHKERSGVKKLPDVRETLSIDDPKSRTKDVTPQSRKIKKKMDKLLMKMEQSVVSEHEMKLEAMRTHYESQIAIQKQRIRELEEKQENDEKTTFALTKRLNKVISSKLTDGNPNIADLSDGNRPTKLAERCMELFDNQWTDAYETVQEYKKRKVGFLPEDELDKEAISILLQVLMESWQFCKDEIHKQDIQVKEAILRTQNSTHHLPDEFLRQLKSTKKTLAVHTAESVFKNFIARKRTVNNFRTSYIEPYVKECVTLCWLMVNQDPQVVFELTAKPGDEFDTKKYREYKRGTHIEFIFWPPMLLHEDGSVLAKGVAQGKPKYVSKTQASPNFLDNRKAYQSSDVQRYEFANEQTDANYAGNEEPDYSRYQRRSETKGSPIEKERVYVQSTMRPDADVIGKDRTVEMNDAEAYNTQRPSSAANICADGRDYTQETVKPVLHERRHQNSAQTSPVMQNSARHKGYSREQLPSETEFIRYLDYLSRGDSSRLVRCLLGDSAYERCMFLHLRMK